MGSNGYNTGYCKKDFLWVNVPQTVHSSFKIFFSQCRFPQNAHRRVNVDEVSVCLIEDAFFSCSSVGKVWRLIRNEVRFISAISLVYLH